MDDTARLLVSHPSPDGSVVICALAAHAGVFVDFVDEDGARDITSLVPDLLLVGLAARHQDPAGSDADQELVTVGRVFTVGGDPELLFAAPAAQLAQPVSFAEARPYIEAGIAAQVTAGIQAEQDIRAEQDTPAADTPAADTPAADTPNAGAPNAGAPDAGVSTGGALAGDTPADGQSDALPDGGLL
jgi:hypothetical protein